MGLDIIVDKECKGYCRCKNDKWSYHSLEMCNETRHI